MDNAQFQQLLAALQQGLQPLQPPPQAPVAFAKSPGQANPDQPIDYSTTAGQKQWQEATAPLSIKFKVEDKQVNQFNEILMERAEKQGWATGNSSILTINVDGNDYNLIREYGRIPMETLRNTVTGYVNNQTRQSQNDYQMFHCIMNSLTEEGRLKILTEQDKYHIGAANDRTPSGPLLFKLLMQKAIIDTRATSSLLRENLSSLDTYMATIKSNIEEFNEYVKQNYEGLLARGERCDDIMINLFKGYMAASDSEFVRYIKTKKDAYDDGGDLTSDALMTLALNKYEMLKKQDAWNAKSIEQEQIVALSAELQKIKDANLKLAKSIKDKKSSKGKKDDKGGSGKSGGFKKGKRAIDKYAWKKEPPKEGQPKTKEVKGRTYHWCEEHMAWVAHLPEKCEVKLERERQEHEKKDNQKKDTKRGALAHAMRAVLTDIEEEDEDALSE
jgi:hypothetical protein